MVGEEIGMPTLPGGSPGLGHRDALTVDHRGRRVRLPPDPFAIAHHKMMIASFENSFTAGAQKSGIVWSIMAAVPGANAREGLALEPESYAIPDD